MVTPEPDIIKIPRLGVNFVIMGCDGIWEKKSNSEMVKWIDRKISD